jgi:hypothetical protein
MVKKREQAATLEERKFDVLDKEGALETDDGLSFLKMSLLPHITFIPRKRRLRLRSRYQYLIILDKRKSFPGLFR